MSFVRKTIRKEIEDLKDRLRNVDHVFASKGEPMSKEELVKFGYEANDLVNDLLLYWYGEEKTPKQQEIAKRYKDELASVKRK